MTFLKSCEVVDHERPEVRTLARALTAGVASDSSAQVRACFEFVRDRVRHSSDHGDVAVTCSASETLSAGTGICYAKSHLLAALLRANGLATGFVYQRLRHASSPSGYCLHGLNAVMMPEHGWVRLDARGCRADLPPMLFDPPYEWLAYAADRDGEGFLPGVFEDPLPSVVSALRRAESVASLLRALPDVALGGAVSPCAEVATAPLDFSDGSVVLPA